MSKKHHDDTRDSDVNTSGKNADSHAGNKNEEILKELTEYKEKVSYFEDLFQRKAAEFENYKKRIIDEKEKFRVMANKDLVMDIFPIIDNFERGLKVTEQTKDFDGMAKGINMVLDGIHSVFSRFQVMPIESTGKEFDPNLHEAVMLEERDDIEEDMVVLEEFEKGYIMGDIVIKHSKVKVGRKKKAAQSGDQSSETMNEN
ncbi:MAG: nucleotide exchange factor GrpE [Brevinematales bacterium]|nr:nucleotide exchange factor GrpE [Brevinematales bacterium]